MGWMFSPMPSDECGEGFYHDRAIDHCWPCEHICFNLWEACVNYGCQAYWDREYGTTTNPPSTTLPYKHVSTLRYGDIIAGLSIAAAVLCLFVAVIILIAIRRRMKRRKKERDKNTCMNGLEHQKRPFLSQNKEENTGLTESSELPPVSLSEEVLPNLRRETSPSNREAPSVIIDTAISY